MKRIRSHRNRVIAAAAAALAAAFIVPANAAGDAGVEPVRLKAFAHFDFNGATLREREKPALLAEVGKMQNVTWQSVTTTGHTDSVGPAKANERLASRRARAVKAYLVSKGLDPTMIRTVAKAAGAPVADNATTAGRARNRRVEVVFEGVRAP